MTTSAPLSIHLDQDVNAGLIVSGHGTVFCCPMPASTCFPVVWHTAPSGLAAAPLELVAQALAHYNQNPPGDAAQAGYQEPAQWFAPSVRLRGPP